MHNNLLSYFFFINKYEEEHIRNLDKKIAIIYRNYSVPNNKKTIIEIQKACKKSGRKFYLSNNLKLALNLNLDGVYLPSFNKNLNTVQINTRKNFNIIGSAHSVNELRIKEKQGTNLIFISPIFKTKKNKKFLNPIKFNYLASKTSAKIIALGGITSKNLNRLKMTQIIGFAGISYFKNLEKIKA